MLCFALPQDALDGVHSKPLNTVKAFYTIFPISALNALTLILLLPPTDEELSRRLRDRATDAADVVARRLAKAKAEVRKARESGAYRYEVVNDDLAETVARVVTIMEKETCCDDRSPEA